MTTPEAPAAPMVIERGADGRHEVKDAHGKVLGKHNSPWSAARQLHEYHKAKAPAVARPAVPTGA